LHKVWKQWLAAYRWVFNWAVTELKNGVEENSTSNSGVIDKGVIP
jgi:hypothetical protein